MQTVNILWLDEAFFEVAGESEGNQATTKFKIAEFKVSYWSFSE